MFPFVLLPLIGVLVWYNSIKFGYHVPVPGFFWAVVVILSVVISLLMGGLTVPRVMTAMAALLPCLLVPILFQGMTSARDRRGVRALVIALLAVTLVQCLVHSIVSMPSAAEIAKVNPDLVKARRSA